MYKGEDEAMLESLKKNKDAIEWVLDETLKMGICSDCRRFYSDEKQILADTISK